MLEKFNSAPTDSNVSLILYLSFNSVPLSSIAAAIDGILWFLVIVCSDPPNMLPEIVITSLTPVGITSVVRPSAMFLVLTCSEKIPIYVVVSTATNQPVVDWSSTRHFFAVSLIILFVTV